MHRRVSQEDAQLDQVRVGDVEGPSPLWFSPAVCLHPGDAGCLLADLVGRSATGTGTVGDIVLAVTVAFTLRQSMQDTLRDVNNSTASGRVIEPYLWLRDHVGVSRKPPR